MDDKVYTLEEIEAYCLGQFSKEEQLAFEQQLSSEDSLQRGVNFMRSILDGFSAMATQRFQQNMEHWSEELQEQDDVELIEWYLRDELGPSAKQYVEQRRQADTEFDALFHSQQAVLEGFEALQADSFAHQLNTWEKESQDKPPIKQLNPWVRRLSIAASIALLVGFGGWGYMKNQYSNQKLFAALYQSPNIGGTLGGASIDAFKEEFSAAHRNLQISDFQDAIRQFVDLGATLEKLELDPLAKSYYQNNIEWSLLLARLGNDQLDDGFQAELERMANDEAHEYQTQAKTLQDKLNSFWR